MKMILISVNIPRDVNEMAQDMAGVCVFFSVVALIFMVIKAMKILKKEKQKENVVEEYIPSATDKESSVEFSFPDRILAEVLKALEERPEDFTILDSLGYRMESVVDKLSGIMIRPDGYYIEVPKMRGNNKIGGTDQDMKRLQELLSPILKRDQEIFISSVFGTPKK